MKFDKISITEFDCLVGSHTSMKSFYYDPEHEDRFEIIGDYEEQDIPPDDECTMHWYDSGVNAVFDLQRFRNKNLLAIVLFDLAMEEHCIVVRKKFCSSNFIPGNDPN